MPGSNIRQNDIVMVIYSLEVVFQLVLVPFIRQFVPTNRRYIFYFMDLFKKWYERTVPCHLLLVLLGWWIEVDAAGGEGQGDALFFEDLDDLQVDRFFGGKEFGEDGGFGKIVDPDLEAALAEVLKVDQDGVRMNIRMLLQRLPDPVDAALKIFAGSGESHFQMKGNPALPHAGPVGDRLIGQNGIGHRHQGLGEGPDPGAAEGDLLHGPLHLRRGDPVAHREGLIGDNDDAGKYIGQDVLCRQRHGQPAQSKAGDKAVDIVPELVEDHDHRQRHDHRLERLDQKFDKERIEPVAPADCFKGPAFAQVVEGPGRENHDQDTKNYSKIIPQGGSKRQYG